jgi:hypothetical protein
MANLNDEILARIDAFASDLTALIQQAAMESVMAALGGVAAAKLAPAAKPVAPPKTAPPRPAARKPAPPKPAPAPAGPKPAVPMAKPLPTKPFTPKARPKGAKRPPAEIAATTARLGEYIAKNPGLGIEAIGKALAIPTSDLTLPIKKLLSDKKIIFKGERRATKYFPAR